MDSDTSSTSSEVKLRFDGDKKTENLKPTESTDLYLNLLANPDKLKPEAQVTLGDLNPIPEDSTSKVEETPRDDSSSSDSDSESRSSSSSERPAIKPLNVTGHNKPSTPNNPFTESMVEPKKELSEKEIKLKKIDYLRKLSELKAKGFELSKEYDFNSSLEEMEYEYELLKSYVDKTNGIKLYKNLLINGVALVEFFNDKYDPFDFQLQGWSEHMSVEVDSYDEVMEELYEKYRGTGRSMPPEIKLLFLVVASGAAFHYSKSTLGKAAGLGKPGMVAGMFNKPKEQSRFMTQQEIHLQNLRNQRMQQQQPPIQSIQPPKPFQAGVSQPPKVEISGDANSILQRMNLNRGNNRMVTETTIDSSDLNTTERRRRGRKPKSVIQINT